MEVEEKMPCRQKRDKKDKGVQKKGIQLYKGNEARQEGNGKVVNGKPDRA